MTEDLVLLEDQARRFIGDEFVPHLDKLARGAHVSARGLDQGRRRRACCARRCRRNTAARAAASRMRRSSTASYSLAGFDTFGAPLHSGIVAPYILHYGTEEQKKRWLPKLATGEMVGAIAMSEPGTGSDLQGVRTTAVKKGNGYVLNGSKTFITNGQHANLIVVVAKTDPKRARQGRLADGGRDRRRAGLPPRPQAQEARPRFRRHVGTVLRGRVSCRPRACSAPRKGRASTSS